MTKKHDIRQRIYEIKSHNYDMILDYYNKKKSILILTYVIISNLYVIITHFIT